MTKQIKTGQLITIALAVAAYLLKEPIVIAALGGLFLITALLNRLALGRFFRHKPTDEHSKLHPQQTTGSIKMRQTAITIALTCALGFTNVTALAADTSLNIPTQKQTQLGFYLSAQEAFELKSSKGDSVLFVDVRTPEEYEFVGHANLADINIPYMKTDYTAWDINKNVYKMESNSNFLLALEDVLKSHKMDKNSTIILMCRSGDRSANAANVMAKAGYTKVYSVIDGFEGDIAKTGDNSGKRVVNGWKNAGLPWEYKMDKDKVYME